MLAREGQFGVSPGPVVPESPVVPVVPVESEPVDPGPVLSLELVSVVSDSDPVPLPVVVESVVLLTPPGD